LCILNMLCQRTTFESKALRRISGDEIKKHEQIIGYFTTLCYLKQFLTSTVMSRCPLSLKRNEQRRCS
jgi:hypothetical protein